MGQEERKKESNKGKVYTTALASFQQGDAVFQGTITRITPWKNLVPCAISL